MRFAALVVAAALAGGAVAQTLAVDASGGPLTLEEDLRAAVAAWQAVADPKLPLEVAPDGEIPVRYPAGLALGPDTLALTLVRQGNEGGAPLEIVVAPERYRASPATLLHELGVVLGLPTNDDPTSAMRAAQSSSSPASPSQADADTLDRLRAAVPEDVNRDGVVDFEDLVALAASFGAQGLNLAADIDGSGTVDDADLEALRAAYTFAPPARTPAPPTTPTPAPDELPEVPEPARPDESDTTLPDGDAPADGDVGTDPDDVSDPSEDRPRSDDTDTTDDGAP